MHKLVVRLNIPLLVYEFAGSLKVVFIHTQLFDRPPLHFKVRSPGPD